METSGGWFPIGEPCYCKFSELIGLPEPPRVSSRIHISYPAFFLSDRRDLAADSRTERRSSSEHVFGEFANGLIRHGNTHDALLTISHLSQSLVGMKRDLIGWGIR